MADPVSVSLESVVVGAVISAAVSTGASLLIAGLTVPNTADTIYPSNSITRGGYLPVLMGRRVVGYHMGWVGDRVWHAAPHSGGSEIVGKPSSGNVYYEGGWHQLCHGPIRRLYRIWCGAKVVWDQMLDSTQVADGTLFQLPVLNNARDADYFRIYFGRDNTVDPAYQPVNDYLVKNTGLVSTYPGLAYIVWQRKNLGASPSWPQMKYEIETQPEDVLAAAVY